MNPRPIPTSWHALRRLTTLVTALVAFAWVATVYHQLAVRHTRCALHGEIIHLADPGSSLSAAPSRTASMEASQGGSEDHVHDLCVVGESAPAASGLFAATPVGDIAGGYRLPVATAPPARLHTLRHLYRLAPKQGPPALSA